jgi:hypothetical protein
VTTAASVTIAKNNLTGSPDDTYSFRCLNILRCADVRLLESTAVNKMTLTGQAINSHNFGKAGVRPQINHGTRVATVSVRCRFTLRTKPDSKSVVINFIAGGAIKLGDTKIVGSNTFDPTAAIANTNDNSINVAIGLNGLANDNFGNEISFEAIYGANAI